MRRIGFLALIFLNGFFYAQDRPCGFKDGLQEGKCKFFFDNGQVKEVSVWNKGKLDGLTTFYYENGKVKSEGKYKRSFKNGTWKYYREDGSLDIVENYVYSDSMSTLDGEVLYYYPSGKLEQTGQFKEGKTVGKWKAFYENGTLKAESTFVNNLREGERKLYDSNGKLTKTEVYKEGKLIETR